MSQKNDRNVSDETFLRDLPIVFDVLIHDPSHFLNESSIFYKWNFGDNTGLFVSKNHTLNHTYVLNGTFNLNLTVQASVPGPCPSPSTLPKPTPSSVLEVEPRASNVLSKDSTSQVYPQALPAGDSPLELSKIPDENCQINRYGYFEATLTIVEGILEVNIIQIADVARPVLQPDHSLKDFTVTCEGTTPREVCTIVSDPSCQLPQDRVCNSVDVDEPCLVIVRRAFKGSGIYCVNFTLGDDTSLAFTSTLISIVGKDPASPFRTTSSAVLSGACLAILVIVVAILVHKKHKKYKPVKNSTEKVVKGKGLHVFLNHTKATFFPGNQEKDPLLKDHAMIL